MEFLMLILCVIPTIVASITVSSNGNSPKIKMIGGMMVDVQKGFVPMTSKLIESTTKSNYDKSRKLSNDSKLSLNERYRRLIPYMTFYYANDLASTTEAYNSAEVEVEKAEIVETRVEQRQPKKIIYSPHRNIPRYHGNRLTQFNIASANPVKVYYKEGVPVYHSPPKVTPNYNPLIPEPNYGDFNHGRFIQKHIVKSPSAPFTPPTRKPFLNFYNNEDSPNVHYYLSSDKEHTPKFKLIPYQQSPPIKIVPQSETIYETNKPIAVPVLIRKQPVYIKPRPAQPQYAYDNVNIQQVNARKIPAVVSESYYEKRRPAPVITQQVVQPAIENGFRPIVRPLITTEAPVYSTESPATPIAHFESEKKPAVQVIEAPVAPDDADYRQNYYQYVVEQPAHNPEEYVPAKMLTLTDLLNSLQLNKSIPKPITRENVGSSIRTLLQVLNALKAMSHQNEVEAPFFSTPKPFIAPEELLEMTPKSVAEVTPASIDNVELHEEPYLAPVNTPSQHLDDFPSGGGTSQQFPPPVHSDEEGGTPGRPGVDYPVLQTIPHTEFDCKTQRYKGFFADPATRCQVWHYCDLNGGQASFLCPNGTIFSQAALTCDWWFNVRCASTTQLYVLNESLYKYILPHSPKFPEDYSGPLVDKYLTLKFKEMEEQFKKNKNKQSASEKIDSDETEDSRESSNDKDDDSTTSEKNEENDDSELSSVSEASVLVESPGTSGNVERLQD